MKNIIVSREKKYLFVVIPLVLLILFTVIINLKEIPFTPPTPVLKYNDAKIKVSEGEHNWFDKNTGGNSYIAGSSYDIGEKMDFVVIEPEDEIVFDLKGNPKSIVVRLWTDYNRAIVYKSYTRGDAKEIISPKTEGEYILEINGEWDGTHNTSHIFKLKVDKFSFKDIKLKANSSMDSAEICKKLFEKYLDSFKKDTIAKTSRIKKYAIDGVSKAQSNESSLAFFVDYSVKPETLINSDWAAGNGEVKGLWFVNKEAYVTIEKSGDDYSIKSMGTGP